MRLTVLGDHAVSSSSRRNHTRVMTYPTVISIINYYLERAAVLFSNIALRAPRSKRENGRDLCRVEVPKICAANNDGDYS